MKYEGNLKLGSRTAGIVTLSRAGVAQPEGAAHEGSYCVVDACLLLPDVESLGHDGPVGGGCHQVTRWMEVPMDERMSGEEVLRLVGRFESLHLPFSSSRRSV